MAVRPKTYDRPGYRSREIDRNHARDVCEALTDDERQEVEGFRAFSYAHIDREASRYHEAGKRHMVVALYRRYGVFEDESAVADYLAGGDEA